MKKLRTAAVVIVAITLQPGVAQADVVTRLLQLLAVPGVSGHEQAVRAEIEMLLPIAARVRADNMGNIVLRTGSGSPHTLIVAPLDEPGVVVSAITDDGYLRVHRHTNAPAARLATQFLIGQPVLIHASSGRALPGVSATPSTHLRAFRRADDEARIKGLDDIWIDVGAESRAEVERLGIRMLDSITLRERASRLAIGRVSGVAAAARGAALALAEIVRRRRPEARPTGTVSVAWVVQSEYGHRGLARVVETVNPDRIILLRGALAPADDPAGAVGALGGGPILQGDRSFLSEAAARGAISTQGIPPAALVAQVPQQFVSDALHIVTLPVRFAQTPVETVDANDVEGLAQLLASAVGFGTLAEETASDPNAPHPPHAPDQPPSTQPSQPFDTLRALIEAYGVSGHESTVRAELLKRMPPWAKPQIDKRGNIRVSFGAPKGKAIVFAAHMDEVGFEIVAIRSDGIATVRSRGGMYLSVYESQPVFVHAASGAIAAVLAPRMGYTTAKEAQPQPNELTLYFGTDSVEETTGLGIAEGQSVTVRKRFMPLASSRATGRAMDDRAGSTALLLALEKIDPAKISNWVTFAWTVEEGTGLTGAAFLAGEIEADTVFAVDTFVSSDTPVDGQRLAARSWVAELCFAVSTAARWCHRTSGSASSRLPLHAKSHCKLVSRVVERMPPHSAQAVP